jgi:hypothetical protein
VDQPSGFFFALDESMLIASCFFIPESFAVFGFCMPPLSAFPSGFAMCDMPLSFIADIASPFFAIACFPAESPDIAPFGGCISPGFIDDPLV